MVSMKCTTALLLLTLAGCSGGEVSVGDAGSTPRDGSAKNRDRALDIRKGAPDKKLPAGDLPRGKLALPGPPPDGPPAAGLKNITLYVNLGDSLAAGYYASSGRSYRALLTKNNDLLYPAYKGKDLASRFPGLKVIDRSKSGAVAKEILAQGKTVKGNPAGNTLVVISAGGNDFNDKIATMTLAPQAIAKANAAAGYLKQLYQHFGDKSRFPGKVTIAQLTIYDSTDGKGSIPKISGLSGFCKTIQGALGLLLGPVAIANLGSFNKILRTAASGAGVVVVDSHAAFLGHGFNYQDKTWKHYKPNDPTLWFHTDCAHGNNRGHHELRRLIWKALTGS